MPATLVPDGPALGRNNFNTLRLVLALLVVWSHAFALWYGTEAGEPLSRLTAGTYNSGNLGVLGFFAISGFLISLSYQRSSSWRSFLAKRVRRIHPGYLAAITLSSLVVVPILSDRPFGSLSADEGIGLASNLLLRNYIVPAPGYAGAINGSLWSIPFEFWCYLGVLALGLTGLSVRRPIILPITAMLVMLARTGMDVTGWRPGGAWLGWIFGYPYFWTMVLPPFLWGATMLAYGRRLPRHPALAAGLIGASVASAFLPLPGTWQGAVTHLLMPPTLAYTLFYVAFHPRWRLGDAARYGDFSYGCYLYAFPLQQVLKEVLPPSGTGLFPLYVALSLAGSLACGVASWFLVERWFEAGTARNPPRPLEEETLLAAP